MRTLPRDRDGLAPREAERLAGALKVLSDPARLRLLSLIAAKGDEGACCCDLADPLGITQPTVSHHLKVLHGAGLLSKERDGVWMCYRVVPEGLHVLAGAIAALVPDV